METAYYESPLGRIKIQANTEGIAAITFDDGVAIAQTEHPFLLQGIEQLTAYFEGKLTTFELPQAFIDTPPFYRQVWEYLQQIPYGTVTTYGAIALALGKSKGASQAVGRAVGANPLAIVIPCHRVIGANGDLTGFRWGLKIKRYLLDLEKAPIQRQGRLF